MKKIIERIFSSILMFFIRLLNTKDRVIVNGLTYEVDLDHLQDE